jgi:WD40 repeat protein
MEKIKYSLIGHKERCFDLKYSEDSSNLLSCNLSFLLSDLSVSLFSSLASEDGTAKLWNIHERKVLHTLTHNNKCEVLRSSFLSDGDPPL